MSFFGFKLEMICLVFGGEMGIKVGFIICGCVIIVLSKIWLFWV